MSAHPVSFASARRLAYVGVTAALLIAVIFEVGRHGHLGLAFAFAVLPDLALLPGISPGLEKGQLHPRAVPLYNLAHRFWGPALLGAAAVAGLGVAVFIAALAWALHNALDRSVGYGLRTPEGFQRDH